MDETESRNTWECEDLFVSLCAVQARYHTQNAIVTVSLPMAVAIGNSKAWDPKLNGAFFSQLQGFMLSQQSGACCCVS